MKIKNIVSFIIICFFYSSSYGVNFYGMKDDKISIESSIFIPKEFPNLYKYISKDPILNITLKGQCNSYDLSLIYMKLNADFNLFKIKHLDFDIYKFNLMYLGIKHNIIGSLDYGKNYGVIYFVDKFTQIYPIFRPESKPNNFMLYKANNVLTYKNNNFFGFMEGMSIVLQKQFENLEKGYEDYLTQSIRLSNGNGHGLSLNYKFNNNLDIAFAYAVSQKTFFQSICSDNNSEIAEAFSLGFKLNTKKIYISSVYGKTYNITPYGNYLLSSNTKEKNKGNIIEPSSYRFANETDSIEILAQYKHKFGLIPSIGYFQSKANGLGDVDNHNLNKYIELNLMYNINDYIYTFIDFKFNLMNKDNFCEEENINCYNEFNIGVNYNFLK